MNPNTRSEQPFARYQRAADRSAIFWEESAILDFTEEVLRRMAEEGVTRTELARRLAVDPAYITKLMGGSNNFTLRTMVKIARALDAKLRFHLQPKHARTEWRDYHAVQPAAALEFAIPVPSSAPSADFSPVADIAAETHQFTFAHGTSTTSG